MARAAEAAQPWERTSPGAGRVLLAGKLPLEIQTFEHSPMIVVLQRIEGEIFLLEGEAGITDWVRGALLVNLGVGRVIVQVVAADREVVIVGEPSTLAGSAGAVTAFRVHRDAPRARAPRRAEVPATPVVDTSAWLGENRSVRAMAAGSRHAPRRRPCGGRSRRLGRPPRAVRGAVRRRRERGARRARARARVGPGARPGGD